jgi:hypothetical protein
MTGVDEKNPDADEEERRAMVGGLLLLEGLYILKAIAKGLGG